MIRTPSVTEKSLREMLILIRQIQLNLEGIQSLSAEKIRWKLEIVKEIIDGGIHDYRKKKTATAGVSAAVNEQTPRGEEERTP